MSVLEYLFRAVERSPDKAAFIERDEVCSFKRLRDDGLAVGTALRARGVKKGEAVLLLQPLSVDLYKSLIGIWSIGAVALVFDPSAGRAHIRACCAIIRPAALIGSRKAMLLTLYSRAIAAIPVKVSTQQIPFFSSFPTMFRTASELTAPRAEVVRVEEVEGEDAALITFTSGSTGVPKAAVRTHAFLANQYEALCESLNQSDDHLDLATLPIVALANIASAMTTVVPNTSLRHINRIDAAAVVKQIRQRKVSRLVASPTFMRRLAEYCELHQLTLPTLTHVYTGGGPVFPPLMEQLSRCMPNSKRYAVYGSTEAEPIAELDWSTVSAADLERMGSGGGLLTGQPVERIDCRIVAAEWGTPILPMTNAEFDGVCLVQGRAGEIVVKGEHVLKGYYNGTGDEENKFAVDEERWHRTGDMGYLDETGRLWLMGRAAAVIRDEMGEVYPFSVEAAIHSQYHVEQIAFLSFEGKRTLVIERQSQHLQQQMVDSISWSKVEQVICVEKIPVDKRHNAKIDYGELKKMLKQLR